MSRKKNEDRNLTNILSDWGFAFEVLRVLVHAILAIGGTIEHLKRLLNEPKLVEQIAKLIVPPVEEVVLRFQTTVSEAVTVAVDYLLPNLVDLKAWFTGYVHPAFDGAVFNPISACLDISRKVENKDFVLVYLGAQASNDEVLAELDRLGLRPAFASELYAYSRANPTAGLEFPIAALGDTTSVDDDRHVAYLDRSGGARAFGLSWTLNDWSDGYYRFLAVRK